MSTFLPVPASCSTVLAKSLAHQELSNWSCVWCLWCPSCMLSRVFCLSSHIVTLLCCLKSSAASQAESTDLSLHSSSHQLCVLSAWQAAGVYPAVHLLSCVSSFLIFSLPDSCPRLSTFLCARCHTVSLSPALSPWRGEERSCVSAQGCEQSV